MYGIGFLDKNANLETNGVFSVTKQAIYLITSVVEMNEFGWKKGQPIRDQNIGHFLILLKKAYQEVTW